VTAVTNLTTANSQNRTDQDYCFPKTVGYQPTAIMSQIDGPKYSTSGGDTADALTRVMILHPIACGLAFIAFLLALGSGFCGALLASIVAAVAWLITLIVMACDFALFGIIKNNVNNDGSGSNAYYSTGMWTVLAAMVALFIAMFLVLFSCCNSRRTRRAGGVTKTNEAGYAPGTTTTTATGRRRFWQRRAAY
jgi:hypothetical protein